MKTSLYCLLPISLIVFGCNATKYLTEETTATCVDYYFNTGNHTYNSIWSYHIGNKIYSEFDPQLFGKITGQAAFIKYYPKDPTAFKVIISKPIFYTDEHTTITKAKVLRVSKKK